MEFSAWLAARGLSADALTEVQINLLRADFEASQRPSPAPTPAPSPTPAPAAETKDLDSVVAAARVEQERKTRITELVAEAIQGHPAMLEMAEAIGRQAIVGKWELQRVELELLRASRNAGGNVNFIVRGKPEINNEVVEAAAAVAGGLQKPEDHYSERALDAAGREFKHGIGLKQIILIGARQNGYRGDDRDLRAMLKAAFRDQDRLDVRAGPSTLSIPNILSNVANKFLKVGFESVEMSWREVSSRRSNPDFKQSTTVALTGDNTLKRLPPGGKIEDGSLGETAYTNQVKTFARRIGIDRTQLKNDDIGALSGASRRLSRGAALALNLAFYTELLNDSAFFPTDKSKANYDDGATDSVLTLAGLDNANNIFRAQTDPDGQILGAIPKILFVPTALEMTALALMANAPIAAAQSTATVTVHNPWAGRFRVVSSAYLADTSLGGSSTAWYLLADPQDLPIIEVAFLDGIEVPQSETAEADFDETGIQMRVLYDFGVSKQEYRGGVKLKGAA